MSGLNDNSLILAYIEQNEYGKFIGMDFQIISSGIVEYSLTIDKSHLATPKAAHGGVLSSLLDSCLGVGALSAVCLDNKVVSTVDMNVSFFSPAFLGDKLICVSKLLKKGNRLIFMEAIIHNQNQVLVAKASATLNAYAMEKAGY